MRRPLLTLILLAACRSTPPVVTPPVPDTPPPPSTPLVPPPPPIAHISSRGDVLCEQTAGAPAPGACMKLVRDFHAGKLHRAAKTDRFTVDLLDGATACTLAGRVLTCGASSEVVEVYPGDGFGYLRGSKFQWYRWERDDPPDKKPALQTMPAIPTGIAQLSMGFRLGCALANDGATWCWSDPRVAPRRMATPPNVLEIAVQDPFELCVRTAAGEIHCTPPVHLELMTCSKKTIHCGTGTVADPVIKNQFDPLAMASRPFARVHAGATKLSRDEDQIYEICMDHHWHVQASMVGGCTLDAAGAVTCILPCKQGWKSFGVTMPPARSLHGDREAGYAIARDGALYTWTAPECDAIAPRTAVRLDGVGPVRELAAPLYLRSGPQSWDVTRCALGDDGVTRCWTKHRGKREVFSPAKLPVTSEHP